MQQAGFVKMGEKQLEGKEGSRRLTTSPLDVVGIDLGVSTDEIVRLVAEGRRSTPPMIEKAATGQPIPAPSTEELAAMEVDEDQAKHYRSNRPQENEPVGTFLEVEKLRQSTFKQQSPTFSMAARSDGMYKGRQRPFCLPVDHAEENLFPGIRETAPAYFSKFEIKWHDGHAGKPSNHLCSSQVCCVNFLLPFYNQPKALAELLRPVFPDLVRMLPIENEQYVAFEWIGEKNYLHEKISRNGKCTRGANFTSADAAVMFEHTDGTRQIVLIEWKYTEAYNGKQSLAIAKSGTDRREIYRWLYDHSDCPLNKNVLPSFDALFYEPFYQLMRQQFLAHEMEKAHELGADRVSVLHIEPARNTDFQRVTSPELMRLSETVIDVWQRLVVERDSFTSISTEVMFGAMVARPGPEIQVWADYIGTRYSWVQGSLRTPD